MGKEAEAEPLAQVDREVTRVMVAVATEEAAVLTTIRTYCVLHGPLTVE